MIVYRLTTGKFKSDISGTGAKIYGGRWNPVGLSALYTAQFISLAILEILVRASRYSSPDSYTLSSFEIPEKTIYEVEFKKLKKDWKSDLEYSQEIGKDFIMEKQFLCLKVPSAIVTQENNFLINPLHPDFVKIKILGSELLELDRRLTIQ
ncbi:MAG: RES family NAD+ phosphorylase [Ginsengibacter sp.]